MPTFPYRSVLLTLLAAIVTSGLQAAETESPDYNKQIQPLFRKYCVACHNADDAEGKLALDSYPALLKGGKGGAVITPGHAKISRLVRMLRGEASPLMPPEDNESPSDEEINQIAAWIDAGAKGPMGTAADPTLLVTPMVKPKQPPKDAITAIAISAQGQIAQARYGRVELTEQGETRVLDGHAGRVNSVAFSSDGQLLVAACGEPGLFGEVQIWNRDGKHLQTIRGHSDSLYAAVLSPDRRWLATAGYDRKIMIWDRETGKPRSTLEGHNGAVYALAFHPSGHLLASASGDRTVKIWDVEKGVRLDTLNQSLKELYTLAFSPDGGTLAAGGVDNRIRIWRVSKSGAEGTNVLLHAVFAHQRPVLRLAFSPDGRTLISSGEDRMIKVWNAIDMSLRRELEPQSDWAVALAVNTDNEQLLAGRLNGTSGQYPLQPGKTTAGKGLSQAADVPTIDYGPQPPLESIALTVEQEPNDALDKATSLSTLPAFAQGVIQSEGDTDLFAFDAVAGDQWIVATRAARDNSPLDSKIEILDAAGKPVPRVLLRAVRDSEVEFRGMNSEQRGARLKNYEEMLLDQYIYLNGEVIKHYQQRRGPDSDSQFYPEGGNRFAFFDTTPRAHPLGQPCYVVVPFPVGTEFPDNGLPTFTLNYENDDDARRELGSDSRLTFMAPAKGRYLIRVTDVRRFGGEAFKYRLIVRRPQPDYSLSLTGMNAVVGKGSGKEFIVKAQRRDGFEGPIHVELSGVPTGFQVTSPVVIQAGQREARGMIHAEPNVPDGATATGITVQGRANVAGQSRVRDAGTLGTIKTAARPKVVVYLEPDPSLPAVVPVEGRPIVKLRPGSMTSCRLRVERHGFEGRIQFDVNNLPHGVIVDDIGLSGVLIPEKQSERIIFLSAEPWVPPTERLFHAVAKVEGNQVSLPMRLVLGPGDDVASTREPSTQPSASP